MVFGKAVSRKPAPFLFIYIYTNQKGKEVEAASVGSRSSLWVFSALLIYNLKYLRILR